MTDIVSADPTEIVTAVVPTHRRPATLRQTLVSIARQRDVTVDVVVVDDADDDATREVVDELPELRAKVVANPGGGGAAGSRNVGLAHVSTRWVAFCDDDDVWAPDKLRRQLQAIHHSGASWSCTGAVTVAPDLSPIGHERLDPQERRTMRDWNLVPGGGSSVLADAEVARDVGGFDVGLSNMEDWDLWIRLVDRGPVASVDLPLVGYRLWPASKSADVHGMRRSARTILERHDRWPPPPEVAYALEWYVMWKMTNAGQRAAGRLAAGLALRHLSARSALRAAALVADPTLVRALDRYRRRRMVPADWRARADAWLPELREALV